METVLTQAQLIAELHYDPDTGIFTRRVARCNRVKIGDVAGCADTHGYWQISVFGTLYLASRLAWLYMTGEWPAGFDVEHADLHSSNNRWSNLRKATRFQNQMNTRARKHNVLAAKCITQQGNRYRLRMPIDGERKHIGYFATVEIAQSEYARLAALHYGEFARV